MAVGGRELVLFPPYLFQGGKGGTIQEQDYGTATNPLTYHQWGAIMMLCPKSSG